MAVDGTTPSAFDFRSRVVDEGAIRACTGGLSGSGVARGGGWHRLAPSPLTQFQRVRVILLPKNG
jgi:hypothetical protein